MRLLLDTHVWLWALLDPERLSKPLASAIQEPANELWLSPMSVWEALLLAERGRIEVRDEPSTWVRSLLQGFPLHEAPLTREVAFTSRTVELDHQDPADRFIAATAIVHDLTLATADNRLLQTASLRTL